MNIIVRPSKLQLSKYPLGALVESEALKILTHLNICRICEATIESLKGIWDTLTCQWLQSLPHDLFLQKTAYQRLLDTLHSPYQSPAQATSGLVSHPDDFLTNWQAARRISTVGKIGRRGMEDRFYYVEPVSEKSHRVDGSSRQGKIVDLLYSQKGQCLASRDEYHNVCVGDLSAQTLKVILHDQTSGQKITAMKLSMDGT